MSGDRRCVKSTGAGLLDQLAVDSEPPIEMVGQDIRAVLLNQRKVKLIERMREDLYRQALEHDEIGVY